MAANRAARYSRILRGQGRPGSRERYLQYLQGINNTSRVGAGRPRSAIRPLSIRPFYADFPTNILIRQSATQDALTATAAAPLSSRRSIISSPGAAQFIRLSGYRAARVILVTGVSDRGTQEISKTTGQTYLKFGGVSNSSPFGKTSANTDNYADATAEILVALLPQGSTGRRVTFSPEIAPVT